MRFESNQVPSLCLPYDVKAFELRPFTLSDMRLLSKAIALDSVQYTIDALSAALGQDANRLTDGDYNFFLSVQRLTVFSKHTIDAVWTCGGLRYKEVEGDRIFDKTQIATMVKAYEVADEEQRAHMKNPDDLALESQICGTHNIIPLRHTDLELITMDQTPLPDARLDWPRVDTLAQAYALKKDPELSNIAEYARWVKEGDTLNEKIAIMEQEGLELFELALQCSSRYEHGQKRLVKKTCPACKTDIETEFSPSTAMFFLS